MSGARQSGASDALITGDELAQMPDHEMCELIDGRIVPMSPTNPEHGRIEANISAVLRGLEILSPENAHVDMRQKVEEYLSIGVRLVMVAEPDSRTITAHRPDGVADRYGVKDVVPCESALRGFHFPVALAFD